MGILKYNMVDELVVIGTGGTISSAKGKNGLTPVFTLDEMIAELKSLYPVENFIRKITPIQLMNIDSSNMQPRDWQKIASQIYEHIKPGGEGKKVRVVITHGTDTMAYTTSAISYMLQNIGIPIIFTGSQRGWTEPETDAKRNLYFAFRAAAENIGGLYVAFNDKIIRGVRVKKTDMPEIPHLDPFDSAHKDIEGIFYKEKMLISNDARENYDIDKVPILDTRIAPESVCIVKLTPGLSPRVFDYVKKDGYKGVIIEAFGQGNMPTNNGGSLVKTIKNLIANGIMVAVGTQTGGSVDMKQYEVGRRFLDIGAIPLFDMAIEAAYTKLIWIFGHTEDPKIVKKMFLTDYVGEIDMKNIGTQTLIIKRGTLLDGIVGGLYFEGFKTRKLKSKTG